MKIDLHIHTVQNKFLDRSFVFSNDLFKEYITQNSLEIVAITNHNLFDLTNFRNIKSLLTGVNCLVLPGIEISLEKGHMLVIFDDTEENLKTLKHISDSISLVEKDDHYSMDVTTFNNLCCGKAAMLIPHYEKSPSVSKTILDLISDDVYIGEVDSPKKFFKIKKENKVITPVYFSDIRIGESSKIEDYRNKSRFTYIDIDDRSFLSLKKALKSNNVFLNKDNIPDVFDILNGNAKASTGINVLIGKRSSGKTYTLDHICEKGSKNCLYIEQFEITNTCEESVFKKKLLELDKSIVLEYVSGINKAFEVLDSLKPLEADANLSSYLTSLEECASQAFSDVFSQCELYNYRAIECNNTQELTSIINAIDTLLGSNKTYHDIIFKTISKKELLKLREYFISELKILKIKDLMINKTNIICKTISDELGKVSSVKQISPYELHKYFKLMYAKKKFSDLINGINERTIEEVSIFDKFKKKTSLKKHKNKNTWKSVLGLPSGVTIDYLADLSPADAYIKYLADSNITNKKLGDEHYLVFYNYETTVVDKKGTPISGGQKAEYSLLSKLTNYKNYDTILIDEMESSFDNPFLNTEIISRLKSIAKTATIFISTHNNNLGVSLQPDYYIYHFVNDENTFLHYCGKSSDEFLICAEDGSKVAVAKTLIDTMEASENAYNDRKDIYEIA